MRETAREHFTVSRKRRTALSLCFNAIPKGKRYALFPRKPYHTFPGIALARPDKRGHLRRGRRR
ncbi:MAG: hypothetical protein E5Y02_10310 [Mesorhizobium sp.]|nr:MAG: hypothetical protein E5Y02_10310 [Mesorhizobium sp.]